MGTLDGRRLVVTRRRGQASTLVQLLVERGAVVLEVPAIEIAAPPEPERLDAVLSELGQYDWLVFTSANAVTAVLSRLVVLGREPRLGAQGPRIASVGKATTAALRASFPEDRVALEPLADYRAGALVSTFAGRGVQGARILVPAADRAREELAVGLRGLGAQVDLVAAYSTVEPPGLAETVRRCLDDGFDLALFASPSAVESFAQAAGERAAGLPVAVIGPTTEAAARAAGFEVRAVASAATSEALVAAVERALPPPVP